MGSYGPRHVLRMHRLPLLSTHMYDLRHYFNHCNVALLRPTEKVHTLARPIVQTEPWSLSYNSANSTEVIKNQAPVWLIKLDA